ncbi:MAG TPA: GTP 3',8-cyclase MoaA [Gemmatimonadales bacterium]|nr:GTP 3',8-cyclase MoaA [Gemmatimonadales bacterium]
MTPRDRLGRPLESLRLSVTDRCNLRCRYCMPAEEYVWLPRASILSFEEMDRLIGVFARGGVRKVRLTGGEPLLRQQLERLVGLIAGRPEIRETALTTNGVLLARAARRLKEAGLSRVTVSLDTLRSERFHGFTRSARLADVLAGIDAARAAGFSGLKVNAVVVRGFNDDELTDLIDFGRERGAEVRFIEYMDVGGATGWSPDGVVTRQEILDRLTARYGPATPVQEGADPAAPAQRFVLPDGTRFGIIASTSAPFCRTCDRARLTADGIFFTCLYAEDGLNLRELLRSGVSDDDLLHQISERWRARTDRGAEARLAVAERGALYQLAALRQDPHREMHTRGG